MLWILLHSIASSAYHAASCMRLACTSLVIFHLSTYVGVCLQMVTKPFSKTVPCFPCSVVHQSACARAAEPLCITSPALPVPVASGHVVIAVLLHYTTSLHDSPDQQSLLVMPALPISLHASAQPNLHAFAIMYEHPVHRTQHSSVPKHHKSPPAYHQLAAQSVTGQDGQHSTACTLHNCLWAAVDTAVPS
jgi:hypothetical protein